VTDIRNNTTWTVTGVYGPQGDLEKKMFIRELRRLKQAVLPKLLLLGDFNLIYKVQDKNNDRLDQRLMLTFRRALNHLEVKEIELIGRKFTWTNSHESPTMTRIDRAFATAEWEERYVHPTAQSLSSSVSDH
jgi:endonuclease/exonuclease/phosphatase family metal-dependent hydrolase